MRTTWTFHSATQLLFGRGAASQLGEIATRQGVKRVLVITDPILLKAGVLEPVHGSLSEAGVVVEVFSGGEPEPSIGVARACIAAARDCRPDALVALGGGSNIDLAKVAAVVYTHGGGPRDYFGENRVPGAVLPLYCLPTTSGTGSEVSAAAVLTDTDNHLKVSTLSNYLRPRLALVDPLLTLTCPAKVTADSGIDALTHAIEAYTAVDNARYPLPVGETSVYQGTNPMADMMAEQAIRLVSTHLRRAVHGGDDLEARTGMALAATLGGLAFSNAGVALVHALEYPIGGATHCSHGAGNGLLLPYVMRFNLPERLSRFAALATLMGEDTAGMDEKTAAEQAVRAVERLRVDIGIPLRLRDLGAKESQLAGFAEKAFGIKRLLRVNPRQASQADLEGILRAAY